MKIFLFTKISLTVLFILTMTMVAEIFGIYQRYGNYIFIVGLPIQIIILTVIVTLLLIKKRESKRGVRIIRHRIEDKYIKGNTDILPSFIGTTNPRKASIFEIFVEIRVFKDQPDFGICKIGREIRKYKMIYGQV